VCGAAHVVSRAQTKTTAASVADAAARRLLAGRHDTVLHSTVKLFTR
jgi:hypothetical protein